MSRGNWDKPGSNREINHGATTTQRIQERHCCQCRNLASVPCCAACGSQRGGRQCQSVQSHSADIGADGRGVRAGDGAGEADQAAQRHRPDGSGDGCQQRVFPDQRGVLFISMRAGKMAAFLERVSDVVFVLGLLLLVLFGFGFAVDLL